MFPSKTIVVNGKWCTKHKYEIYWEEENKRTTSSSGNYEGYDVILLMLNSKIKKFNNKKRNT
jgi:hypothetical protein